MYKPIFKSLLFSIVLLFFMGCSESDRGSMDSSKAADLQPAPDAIPDGMVYIPGGSFEMGGKSAQASQDEFPRHKVAISPFFMDITEVTNNEFEKFVEATHYVTIAEKDIDWEEMKKQVPEGTPKPPDSVLVAGPRTRCRGSRRAHA